MSTLLILIGCVMFALAIRGEVKAFSLDIAEARAVAVQAKGAASYYGEGYRGKRMANGQPFDPRALTCATWDWPLGSVLKITYKVPGFGIGASKYGETRTVIVEVTDRGPSPSLHRVIDLSEAAFKRLAPLKDGIVPVDIELVLGKGAT